jgi:hypothetical protein
MDETECVSAPDEIKLTLVSAYFRILSMVIPPEASVSIFEGIFQF